MKRCIKYLALITAAAPLFPGPLSGACPIASDTNVVFYGQTENNGGVEAASRRWIVYFLDWWKTQDPNIKYVELNSNDIKTGCNLVDYPNVRVYLQPGGNAYYQQYTLSSAGKSNINSYIDSGRVYVGFCAGFYYAAQNYYFDGVFYAWPYLLGKYPATVEGDISNIAVYPSYALTDVSGYGMIYYGGPTIGWNQTLGPPPGEVLLTFDSIPSSSPAVIKYNNLLLVSPHPEAYENDGITGLTTAQRTENYIWLAAAINNIASTVTAASPAFSPVSSAAITANWQSSFPSGTALTGTTHYAQISTGAFPNVFSGNLSSATFGQSAGFSGLRPNTTYYARVSIIGAAGPFIDLGSTSTLSVPVSGAQLYMVHYTSITANWLPLPASPPEASSSSAGGYLLQISTDGGFSGPVYSSTTLNVSLSTLAIAGLTPNTTWYSRVGSLNRAGAPNYTLLPSTITPANAPGDHSIPILNLGPASLRFQWTGNENPPGTDFTAYLSTAADFTGSADLSSSTLNTYADFSGLTGNTGYYLGARAIGRSGQPSAFNTIIATATIPQAPAPENFSAVTSSGITANWTAGTNGAVNLSYLAQISTSSVFAAINDSSATANTSALFGPGGQGAPLTPNTTYFLRVQGAGLNGPGPFAVLGATTTLANIPGTHASPVAGLGGASLSFQWTENGNPPGTSYTALLSTGSGFTGAADRSSDTIGAWADFSGLTGNTAYYMKVQAVGRGGAPSGFGQPVSTITFPQAPAAGAFSAVTSSGLTAGWTAGTNDVSGLSYTAQISTEGAFAAVMDSSGTLNTSASFGLGGQGTPLTPNIAYYLRVQASGYSGPGPYAGLNSTVTLANPPGQTGVISVTSTTISLDWSANGNPEPGTDYEVWLDTQPGFTNSVKAAVPASARLINGLVSKTTYYFRVRAVNLAGTFSGFDDTLSTRTYPAPPGALSLNGTALGISSITWTWNDAGEEDGYRLLSPAGGDVSGVIAADAAYWHEINLSTNTAYTRKAAAFNISGASTSTLATRYTLAAPPTGFILTGVYLTSAAVQWASGTNPAGTDYELKYWAAGGSTATLTVALTSAALTGLAGGAVVYALVRALNGDNIPTSYDTALSTLIPATVETVSPDAERLLTFQGPSGEIKVVVLMNTFAGTVQITVRTPVAQNCLPPTGGLRALATPVCVEIALDKPLQPARPVELSVSYLDGDLGGLDENKLILSYYDDAQSAWVPLFSGRNAAANKVTGKATHFSVFQIMQSDPAQDLSNVTIGPNILRPGLNPGQFMTFRNLPAGARVRVYTLVGELLHDTAEDGTGNAVWNGKNRSGKQAASGIYLALIEAGAKKKVFRVAVER